MIVRALVVVAALAMGATAVVAQQEIAAQQQALMKAQSKNLYGVLLRVSRGQSPYEQAAIDAALVQLAEGTAKIASVFATNPKMNVPDSTYGSSPKIWESKADFDSKVPAVAKVIEDAKGKIKDVDTLKVAYEAINKECNVCHETYRVKLK